MWGPITEGPNDHPVLNYCFCLCSGFNLQHLRILLYLSASERHRFFFSSAPFVSLYSPFIVLSIPLPARVRAHGVSPYGPPAPACCPGSHLCAGQAGPRAARRKLLLSG